MFFISRDACSDSIAKLFCACFRGVSHNYRAIRAKWGIAQLCLCAAKYQLTYYQDGVSHLFGELRSSLKSIPQYGVSQQ